MRVVKNIGWLFAGALIGSLVLQITDALGESKAKMKIGYVDMDSLLSQHPKRPQYEKALQQFIQQRQQDIQSKSSLPGLTEEQKKKVQLLTQQYEKEVMEKDRELTQKMLDDIQKKIKEVASQKSFDLVLHKSAVLYGGVNITQDVLKLYKSE